MKYLQEQVIFNVVQAAHLKTKEQIEIKLEPISDTVYKNIATTRLADRKTNKMTRIFLNSVKLKDVSQMPNLVNKKVKATIVEFSKKDGSKFIGVDTYSIDLIDEKLPPVTKSITSIKASKPFKKKINVMKNKNMTDIAVDILIKENRPYHYKTLISYMISNDLFYSKGKTPAQTLVSNIGKEIKTKGENSRFVKLDKGIYGLNQKLYPQFNMPDLVTKDLSFTEQKPKKSFLSKLFSFFL